VFIKHYYEA